DAVDRVYDRVDVGIGRQQHALGVRKQLQRFLEKLDAIHTWHAMVRQEQGGLLLRNAQLTQDLERLRTGLGAHDAEPIRILPPQVTGERLRHTNVVVDGEEHWFRRHVRRAQAYPTLVERGLRRRRARVVAQLVQAAVRWPGSSSRHAQRTSFRTRVTCS